VKNSGIAWVCALLAVMWSGPAQAQQLQALARLDGGASAITSRMSGDVDIQLGLTQGVPFRVFTLGDPARLVLDFREVRFDGVDREELVQTDRITETRFGLFRPGWSRMVLTLAGPMRVSSAEMTTDRGDGSAEIHVLLTETTAADFAARSGSGQGGDLWKVPAVAESAAAKTRPLGDRKIVVAVDPGHGGVDPGAQHQGLDEADLMLTLARELKEKLILSGNYEVFLTREEDYFLSLQGRVTRARAKGADVFLSLHADALKEGTASGTTVYTLSAVASDEAAATLAEGHERSDILAGVDLSQQDDLIATILMDMARIETLPRSEKLADHVVRGMADSIGKIRARPRLSAGFSVLKAPDIPSILIEFGFMSNPRDLANLNRAERRSKAIDGIVVALDAWSIEDAAEARLLRK